MSKAPVYDTKNKKMNEAPPSLRYKVDFASEKEKKLIIKKLKLLGRQTMNFRTSGSDGHAIVLRDLSNNRIAGWQGLDISRNDLVEKFSLHLEPNYRKFLLGLVLELAFASYLQNLGIAKAYVRMDASGNSSLKDWRLKTKLFKEMDIAGFDRGWLDRCHDCELYRKSCLSQVFIQMDIDAFIGFGMERLSFIKPVEIPSQIQIQADVIRRSSEQDEKQYKLRQVA